MFSLFFLVNVVFSVFFFVFWRFIEGVIFWFIALIFFIYFNPLEWFSSHSDDEDIDKKKEKNTIISYISSLKVFFTYGEIGSYYLSFSLFYLSLYGIAYGVNSIYGILNFLTVFHILSFILSFFVSTLFVFFPKKFWEVTFLLFRSNFIIFSVIYGIFLIFLIFSHKIGDGLLVFNTLFSFFWLIGTILFDPALEKIKPYSIYLFFLSYIFLLTLYFLQAIFPIISIQILILSCGVFYSIIYFFLFPKIQVFALFTQISRQIWVILNYFSLGGIFLLLFFYPLTITLFILMIVSATFQYLTHVMFENYLSFSFTLLTTLVLYSNIFFPSNTNSFLLFYLFIFSLPSIYTVISLFFRLHHMYDRYFLQSFAMIFWIGSAGYYFIFISRPDILTFSLVLMGESLLIFFWYLWAKALR